MRIVILLHPTNKRGTKTAYTKFRSFLNKDGYYEEQHNMFIRTVVDRKMSKKHLERLKGNVPNTGTIRLMLFTEIQYKSVRYLTGMPSYQERIVGTNDVIFL